IRLLIVSSGRRDGELKCFIDIDSIDQHVTHKTISCSWGDPTDTCPILVNGLSFDITTNLHTALRHLQSEDDTLTIWVCAICIKQMDE
ncbi:hypothetical protein BJ878DRAFT_414648, partial [Calycina marina]